MDCGLDKNGPLVRPVKEIMPSERELERLYDEHARALFAFLLNLTRNEADAHDALQEMFVRLASKPGLLEGVRTERAFLLRLAHNQVIDQFRRRDARERHQQTLAEDSIDLFTSCAAPDEEEFRHQLSAALGELPPEQRAVVHLKLWEGLTFEQIAEALEIPVNTAASRYRYGIDKLRARLRLLYEEL